MDRMANAEGLADRVIELNEARINTLEVALNAALAVMREWLNRIEVIEGKPMVNIEDEAGAKRLYMQLVAALAKK